MRNQTVDIIRGFAMLLVVLGHTLSGSTSAYSDSFLFQVIWTLQMPLFIMISGYVTCYSRPIVNASGLWKLVKKRTLAYLLPWVVWTIFVRALIFGQTNYLDFKYLFWHMDSGYWFLITIWTISMIFGVSDCLSNIFFPKKVNNAVWHLAFCGVGMILLAGIGLTLGLNFFCIKLTLYYLPIYLVGYLYGQMQEWLQTKKNFNMLKNCGIGVSMVLWLALITRFDFYGGGENGLFVIGRFATSILGCVSIIGLFVDCYNRDNNHLLGSNKQGLQISTTVRSTCVSEFLKWVGIHSLELYLIHGFSLCILKLSEAPKMYTIESWLLLITNFAITVLLSYLYIRVIESNKVFNKILFWK